VINPINYKMIAHPMNWLVVILMLIIAGTLGALVADLIGLKPQTISSTFAQIPAGQRAQPPVGGNDGGSLTA
jgi:hypothetical protein